MTLFEQFVRERRYLHNISPSTISWYSHALKWLPGESPTQAELKDTVMRMREKGLKATGCNAAIRAINAYLRWAESPLKIPQMKEPETVLPTFTAAQVKRLVSWKPHGFYERRLHLLVLFMLDTGSRISEALNLHVRDVDLDNLLVTLDGKGRKQRIVPISLELRRVLFRYIVTPPDSLLFATQRGTRVSRMTMLRAVKNLCVDLGFNPPPRTLHAIRHTFALTYVRRGGSVFHLQKVLGHSSLEMTRRYASLQTADLQAVHERVSLLSKG